MNNSIAISGYTSFIESMAAVFKEKFPADTAKKLIHFTYCYYLTAPFEELTGKSLEDLCGATVCAWEFLQQRFPSAIHVRVFNPDFEQHGWQSPHTIVEVLTPDMPFIVDSVRMEINRRGLNIYFLNSAVVKVERDADHQLISLAPRDSTNEAGLEALVHLEIGKISDPETLQEIDKSINQILQELTVTIHDFPAMREKLVGIVEELDECTLVNLSDKLEAVEFLNWLIQGHFTFLASRDYRFDEKGGLEVIAGSDLGSLKKNQYLDLAESHLSASNSDNDLLAFSKSSNQSKIHRPAWADVIAIKRFDAKKGNCVGEHRLLGLYTSRVFRESCRDIPLLKRKVDEIFSRAGLNERSHGGKSLLQILEVYPREELFQTQIEDLYNIVIGILHIQERRKLRLFIRPDIGGCFVSCLVFVPRDRYSTELRYKFQEILAAVFPVEASDFTTYFSESVLARVHIVLKLKKVGIPEYNVEKLEASFLEASRNWSDDLSAALIESFGEDEGSTFAYLYSEGFSVSYRDSFSVRTAVADIHRMASMDQQNDLAMIFHRNLEAGENAYRFKLFHWNSAINLSDVLPVLENMGLRVLSSSPHVVVRGDKQAIWIHDFMVECRSSEILRIDEIQSTFQEAFERIWHEDAENDGFNQLVLATGLDWREVALLRAYAKYLKQIKFAFSQSYIESTLVKHRLISSLLVKLFHNKFNPETQNESDAQSVEKQILTALDSVSVLDEDLILRRYLDIVRSTLRTNYFQRSEQNEAKAYISFKVDPSLIPGIPLPLPMFEVFVYSPRVEAVHLRGGKVARGGIRWSDRREDFRTEVLGLVKAQQVKNAVIVPVGAKGGFVPKRLPINGSRDDVLAEVITCYKTFIRGLLDLTDNLISGKIVPPKDVVRKDPDDPYLVVAADKGTATFSDIANSLSAEYNFWLGDAFASGGSQGYDHKKMGITARGAWISVQRLFRELGIDPNIDTFSVIGIGDMSGDVFGNGMLRSDNILLLAAFDHRHIFIDPSPDSKLSYAERKRLFYLPRSSWGDYAKELISSGGGVFDRSLKSITITPEMKTHFSIQADKLTPTELISHLLKAKVDLIWNGGIGTYIKSSKENNSDVGDKSNDALRINGSELNARVLCEGGNLGTTQLGRIEFALKNGNLNTDFIDNAAGVDCSDHEVNLKIVLNQIVANGDLTLKQRNQLLVDMTDEVAALVLKDNYRQVQAISLAKSESVVRLGEYRRLIHGLEKDGKLNRALEFIPNDEILFERNQNKIGLTRPELAILLSYSKAVLKERLAHSDIAEDPHVAKEIALAFPQRIVETYHAGLYNHKLRKEIIATQVANGIVNFMGSTFVNRMKDASGAQSPDIARAFIAIRDVFQMNQKWEAIEALDFKVSADVQTKMMLAIIRLVRRGTRWLLRNRRTKIEVSEIIEKFAGPVESIAQKFELVLSGERKKSWEEKKQFYNEKGVPVELSSWVAGSDSLLPVLGISEAAIHCNASIEEVAAVYFGLGDRLGLYWFSQQVDALKVDSHWQALAREAYRDDLEWQQRALTISVLQMPDQTGAVFQRIERWCLRHDVLVSRWHTMLEEIKNSVSDFPMHAVALRELMDLAQSSVHNEKRAAAMQ